MAALGFPTSPSVGDRFTSAAGWSWRWDGHKWAPTGGGGGAFQDAPSDGLIYGRRDGFWSEVAPLIGVSDGSAAAPGEIGEYIRQDFPEFTALANGQWRTVGTLTVPAGDWDASCRGYISPQISGTIFSGCAIGIGETSGNNQPWLSQNGQLMASGGVMDTFYGDTSLARLNYTVATPIYLQAFVIGANGGIKVTFGAIFARRIR